MNAKNKILIFNCKKPIKYKIEDDNPRQFDRSKYISVNCNVS